MVIQNRHSMTSIVLFTILVTLLSSDRPSLSSTTTFVTAAWASSSSWNQRYRTTAASTSSSPSSSPSLYHHQSTAIWGQTKTSQRSHYNTCRGGGGGNQDRKGYHTALSMADTTTATSETTEQITNVIASSGLSLENYHLLSDRGKIAIFHLIQYDSDYQDQTHIYHNWPPPGTDDDNKIRLSEQVIHFP
jgi:hypothetical protein